MSLNQYHTSKRCRRVIPNVSHICGTPVIVVTDITLWERYPSMTTAWERLVKYDFTHWSKSPWITRLSNLFNMIMWYTRSFDRVYDLIMLNISSLSAFADKLEILYTSSLKIEEHPQRSSSPISFTFYDWQFQIQ